MNKQKHMDRGWSWMVAAGSFVILGIVVAYVRNAGIFFVALQEKTKASASEVAWISTWFNIFQQVLTPLSVVACGHFGTRPVVMLGGIIMSMGLIISHFVNDIIFYVLTLGVMEGIGGAMCLTPAVIVLSHHFVRRIGLATAFVFSGCSIGHMVLAPLFIVLFNNFDVQGALLIMGGITLHIVVAGALFFPVKSETNHDTQDETKKQLMVYEKEQTPETSQTTLSILKDLLKNASFYTLAFTVCCGTFVYISTYKYIPSLAADLDIPHDHIGYMFTVGGFADLLGRLFTGPLTDTKFVTRTVKRYRITALGLLLMGVNNIALSFCEDKLIISVCLVIHAAASGTYYATLSVACQDILGPRLYPVGFSITHMSSILMTPMDSLILGHLRDHTGNYQTTFMVLSAVGFIGTLTMLSQQCLMKLTYKRRALEIQV